MLRLSKLMMLLWHLREYHRATWIRIGMNSDKFPGMMTNALKSTYVHELGHTMGLYDLTSGTGIMNIMEV